MSEPKESRVKEKFRRLLTQESLSEDVQVFYRVAGGMPEERIEHEFELAGDGRARVRMADALRDMPAQETSAELDQDETRKLLEEVGVSLDELVPRSEARFLPDSVVGMITIEAEGERATFFFLADEDQRIAEARDSLPVDERAFAPHLVAESPLTGAIQSINSVSDRLLAGEKEQDNE
jgi:hypothetical protein